MSQVRSLERLPVEILRRIVGYLTAISAFDFLLVCRNIYNACDDWTVWRAIVKASLDLPAGSPNSKEITQGMWKRFAVADMKADQASHVDNVTAWLPQMMALHHRSLLTIDPQWLYQLSDPTYYDPQHAAFEEATNFDRGRFPTNRKSPIDISIWQAAQSNSFCFAARLLSYELPSDGTQGIIQNPWGPREPLLHTADWLFVDPDDPEIAAADVTKLATQLHTLANKAVALFSMELRSALAASRVANSDPTGLAHPPSAFDIPFQSFIKLPKPFTQGCAGALSTCHLSVMASPSFFEDGEWTGYFSFTGKMGREGTWQENPTDYFDGIGGETNRTWLALSNPPLPFTIERSVRFQVVRTVHPHSFVVRSNYFHSQIWTHIMEMTVETQTGLISIDHHNHLGAPLGAIQAVITPFGIISGLTEDVWFWLWKKNWTATL